MVFLNDGSIYRGYIKSYTFDPDATDQDFLLSEAVRVNEDLHPKYRITGQGVYLRTRDVRRIEFLKGEETDKRSVGAKDLFSDKSDMQP